MHTNIPCSQQLEGQHQQRRPRQPAGHPCPCRHAVSVGEKRSDGGGGGDEYFGCRGRRKELLVKTTIFHIHKIYASTTAFPQRYRITTVHTCMHTPGCGQLAAVEEQQQQRQRPPRHQPSAGEKMRACEREGGEVGGGGG